MAKKEHPSHIWTGVIVGACLLTVVSIFLLKRASDRRSPVYTQLHPEDTVAVKERMPVARPDTTIDATYLPILRGYGEGYQKGFEDGAKGKQFNIGN